MMIIENGNKVVAVGYMVGMNDRERIGCYRLGIRFSKNGTKNDYLFGNVCVQTVTMLKNTSGADRVYKCRVGLKDQLIAIEFKQKFERGGHTYWTVVAIKAVDENDPDEYKKVTVKDARFIMDLNNSETEKNIMNWCQIKAEGNQDHFEPEERVIPSECIEGNHVNRRYGIKTAIVANGNNFNYYLHNGSAQPHRRKMPILIKYNEDDPLFG